MQIDEEEGDIAQMKDKDHSKQLMGLILENNVSKQLIMRELSYCRAQPDKLTLD